MKLRSLSSRLTVFWIVGSLIAFFSTPATIQIPLSMLGVGDPYQTLEIWTTRRAREVVVRSLRRASDGSIFIEKTDALAAHMSRNRDFRFAVFDPQTGAILPGSSEELAQYFKGLMTRVDVFGSLFHIANDPNPKARGYVRTTITPFGRLGTIVYGASFHWDDVLYQLYMYFDFQNMLAYIPLCTILSVVAFVVVRRGLAPLRAVATKIGRIDVNSLDQRIAVDDIPSEVLPFVEAVNSAFRRVDEGVARQRRFTANSAHELRTPIAILRARLEKMDETSLKHDIKRDARRIQTILEQLLVLSQIEEQSAAASPSSLNLAEVVLSVILDYMPLAMGLERHVAFESCDRAVMIRGHHWAIESVVTNLIENAVRAEPVGGTVVVRLSDDAIVEVVDHGAGVAPDDREMVFEPFWRKSETTPGTGLGLAMAKELMERQGGRIWVEETAGGGATFKLSFLHSITDS